MNYSRVRQQLEEYYKKNIKNEHKSRKIGFSYYANDDEDLEEGSGTDTNIRKRSDRAKIRHQLEQVVTARVRNDETNSAIMKTKPISVKSLPIISETNPKTKITEVSTTTPPPSTVSSTTLATTTKEVKSRKLGWMKARINHPRFKKYFFEISYDNSRKGEPVQVVKRRTSKTCSSINTLNQCKARVEQFWRRQEALVNRIWRRKFDSGDISMNVLLFSRSGALPTLYDFRLDKYIVQLVDESGRRGSSEYYGFEIMEML